MGSSGAHPCRRDDDRLRALLVPHPDRAGWEVEAADSHLRGRRSGPARRRAAGRDAARHRRGCRCRRLRAAGIEVPTDAHRARPGRGRIEGLDAGRTTTCQKPFDVGELLASCALTRRSATGPFVVSATSWSAPRPGRSRGASRDQLTARSSTSSSCSSRGRAGAVSRFTIPSTRSGTATPTCAATSSTSTSSIRAKIDRPFGTSTITTLCAVPTTRSTLRGAGCRCGCDRRRLLGGDAGRARRRCRVRLLARRYALDRGLDGDLSATDALTRGRIGPTARSPTARLSPRPEPSTRCSTRVARSRPHGPVRPSLRSARKPAHLQATSARTDISGPPPGVPTARSEVLVTDCVRCGRRTWSSPCATTTTDRPARAAPAAVGRRARRARGDGGGGLRATATSALQPVDATASRAERSPRGATRGAPRRTGSAGRRGDSATRSTTCSPLEPGQTERQFVDEASHELRTP